MDLEEKATPSLLSFATERAEMYEFVAEEIKTVLGKRWPSRKELRYTLGLCEEAMDLAAYDFRGLASEVLLATKPTEEM